MGVADDLSSRIGTIESQIDTAVSVLSTMLSIIRFYGSGTVTAGQSTNAAGTKPPEIDAKRPGNPNLDMSDIATASKYSSGFAMPKLATISDSPPDAGWEFDWNDKTYAEWMLTELKAKITTGFDDVGIVNALEQQIWNRRDARQNTVRSDALIRRNIRWSQRGQDVAPEMIDKSTEQVVANVNYAIADNARDRNIKRAELKDDNRKFSIGMALKGEAIYIDLQEGLAERLLESIAAISKLTIESFKVLVNYYTDVTIKQYLNESLHFTEKLSVEIATKKADIKRYIANTRIVVGNNKKDVADFDIEVNRYAADAYFNDVKAQINMIYNKLSLDELVANRDLILKQIDANLKLYKEAMSTNKEFINAMGKSYSQYVAAASQSVNMALQASSDYTKAKVIE